MIVRKKFRSILDGTVFGFQQIESKIPEESQIGSRIFILGGTGIFLHDDILGVM